MIHTKRIITLQENGGIGHMDCKGRQLRDKDVVRPWKCIPSWCRYIWFTLGLLFHFDYLQGRRRLDYCLDVLCTWNIWHHANETEHACWCVLGDFKGVVEDQQGAFESRETHLHHPICLIIWDINHPPWFISDKYPKKEMISPHSHHNFLGYCPKKLLEGEKYESMKDAFWWYKTM